MVMRLSLLSRNRFVLANNNANLARASELQEQLSSGKRVNTISDDPIAARRAMNFRVEQFTNERFQDNINRTQSFLDVTDSTVAEMVELVGKVKENAVTGANGTQDEDSRKALARSIDAQITRMVDLTNSEHDGRYIFAGTEVFTPPFKLEPEGDRVTYHGNRDVFSISISPSESVSVNQNGADIFQGDVNMFETLIAVRDALDDDDGAELSSLIADVDGIQRQLGELQGEIGGRIQRLDLAERQLDEVHTQLSELISQELDVDMTDAIMNLQLTQVSLEAGLQTSARILQPSLLDFL